MFCKLNDVTKCKAGLTESSMFIKNYSEEHQYCEMFSNQKHISMAVTGLEILIYNINTVKCSATRNSNWYCK